MMRDMNDGLANQTVRAFKWSSITELVAKLISPCINMVLARILDPEAFGMLATVTMVISFAEIFVESGFQKFLIQHNFENDDVEKNYLSVAFWSNLTIALLLWAVLFVFADQIAILVGNKDADVAIAVSAIAVPLYGIVGLQNCILKKRLEFKRLFYVRIAAAFTPAIITLPLALCGMGYWALIIGNISSIIVQIVVLSVVGKYRPILYFDFCELKYMLGFGIWTLLDGLLVWASNWIDSLLISNSFNDYYLGLYKNSSSTIISIFTIVTAAITPVMFSSLSKLQNEDEKFRKLFLLTHKYLCVLLLPIGTGLFLYRDFVTLVMFGEEWYEAADIVGIMALSTVLRTIFVSFYSDLYRAKGHFGVPLVLQMIDVCILIPLCVISLQYGFWNFVYVRGLAKLVLVVPEFICAWYFCGLSPKATIRNIWHSVIAAITMCVFSILLQQHSDGYIWSSISIVICALIYFSVIICFKEERELLIKPMRKFVYKKKNKNI